MELETGKILQQHDLDADFFGEGIAFWKDQLVQLTWKNRTAIYYDLASFRERQRYSYRGEGWGLTSDGRQLIMSDGTATLRFVDPTTFAVQRELVVRDGNRRDQPLERVGVRRGRGVRQHLVRRPHCADFARDTDRCWVGSTCRVSGPPVSDRIVMRC